MIGVLGTFEDVTERRAAEDNLQRTLAELDERVKQRTTQLMRANESLRREVEDRVRIQAEERQQRSYAEALSDSAAAMSSTLDLDEVMEHVLDGVERLVSNDLTAIILIDQDGTPYIARQRVGFGYGVAIESHLSESLSSLDVIGRLRGGHRLASSSMIRIGRSVQPSASSARRCGSVTSRSGSSSPRAR